MTTITVTISSVAKEELEAIVKKSTSWMQVMRYFKEKYGYKNISANKTVKKRCIKENISFDHFPGNKESIEEFLKKEEKQYDSAGLRKRLIRDGQLEEKCYSCNIGNIWNENSLTLQLEHVDGNHYNNDLKNLILLCPNCHSQTETWCRSIVSIDECVNDISINASLTTVITISSMPSFEFKELIKRSNSWKQVVEFFQKKIMDIRLETIKLSKKDVSKKIFLLNILLKLK